MSERKDYITPQAEERLQYLRNAMLIEPQVCVEKAKYTTETFRATEGAPIEYRRSMALENVLSHLTIGIGEQELIVGRPTGKMRGGPLSPEVNASWYTKEMDSFHTREYVRMDSLLFILHQQLKFTAVFPPDLEIRSVAIKRMDLVR